MAAVCMTDAGNEGVLILAEHLLPPRKAAVMIPGPQVHAMKLAFEKYYLWKPPRLRPAAIGRRCGQARSLPRSAAAGRPRRPPRGPVGDFGDIGPFGPHGQELCLYRPGRGTPMLEP